MAFTFLNVSSHLHLVFMLLSFFQKRPCWSAQRGSPFGGLFSNLYSVLKHATMRHYSASVGSFFSSPVFGGDLMESRAGALSDSFSLRLLRKCVGCHLQGLLCHCTQQRPFCCNRSPLRCST